MNNELRELMLFVSHTIRFILGLPSDMVFVKMNKELKETIHQDLFESLSDVQQKMYPNKPINIQIKLLMSTSKFRYYLKQTFGLIFPGIENVDEKDFSCIKQMTEIIWPDSELLTLDARINKFIDNQPLVQKFCELVEKYNRKIVITENFKFIIFGCPESTDLDILIIISETDFENGCVIDEDALRVRLDTPKEIDINYCCLDDVTGDIIKVSKGCPAETQNIVLGTFGLRDQTYECPFKRSREINIIDRIGAINKFILSFLEDLLCKEQYLSEKDSRDLALQNPELRAGCVMTLLPKIKRLDDNRKWFNAIKSLTVKIVQIMLLSRNQSQSYTKELLADRFEEIYPGEGDHVRWLLFRGTKGSFSEQCLEILLEEYSRILTTRH